MLNKFILWIIAVAALLFLFYRYFVPRIPKRAARYPYALLLGCPSHDDGTMSTSQILRCQTAMKAWKEHSFDRLIISGSNVKNEFTEALVMKEYIDDRCAMPILTETKARNTYENLKYAREMIGDVPLLIITSSLHAPRACAMARDFFSTYSACTYPDHKPRHIFREIVSRLLFIWIEIKKKFGLY